MPKNNQEISYCFKRSDAWIQSTVLRGGGKVTGRNWSYLNINDRERTCLKVFSLIEILMNESQLKMKSVLL